MNEECYSRYFLYVSPSPQVTLTDPLAEAAPLSWARHGVLSCSHNTCLEFPASSLGPEQRARYVDSVDSVDIEIE